MLVSMSATEWSELGVSGLPTGTVTLLLADVEGSTGLWESQPHEMSAAIARFDDALRNLIEAHRGVRPVEQGEGDSFVLAFARASDAVACALALQRAPLAPIRLRIGINTGEIQLRDEGNYIGPTINRTARLRDLAHGGQTVLSGATESMVIDHLPADAWLNDLGSHPLRDLPRPERVVQLCHPDIRNDFPPLRVSNAAVTQRLPVQLTRFVGRADQIENVRQILADNRLVTLTGAGGVGKTRLAVEVALKSGGDVWYVDLAPITDADVVPVAVIRALGLLDQPGRPTMDTLLRYVAGHRGLMVLDNCEHLLDACADLILDVLKAGSGVTLLATSREPIGVAGEVTWRVPSLSLDDEAVELFADRARLARPDFSVTDENVGAVTEICRRLDGIPLAIELAAARVRALSSTEILDSLRDRFRLLTGGSRTAVRRQQTLRASVDWSHGLLTESEQVLLRGLSAFVGGFDLAAAQAVTGGRDVERHQVLDLLTLLVDKSLVATEDGAGRTRYRLLETIRQYGLEKLVESGEADEIRNRHRDHYTALAGQLDRPGPSGHVRLLGEVETEIDNLRAAFSWSQENNEIELAMRLSSSLLPLWLMRGRIQEGWAWFSAITSQLGGNTGVAPAVRARALADEAVLHAWAVAPDSMVQVQQALSIARELDDPVLLVHCLAACIGTAAFNAEAARPYIAEAIDLARELGDEWRLSQILGWQAYVAILAGDPIEARAAGEEGRILADAAGDRFMSRMCRYWGTGTTRHMQGDLMGAIEHHREIVAEADADGDAVHAFLGRIGLGHVLAGVGETAEAYAVAEAAVEIAPELSPYLEAYAYAPLAVAALADGDLATAEKASDTAWQRMRMQPEHAIANVNPLAEIALARGDVTAARKWADDSVSMMSGWHLARALTTRARIALAQGELDQAERDAQRALTLAAELRAHQVTPDALESLAELAARAGSHRESVRLLGAANALRQRMGSVRFKIYQGDYEAVVERLRNAMGKSDFDSVWAEGAALSTEDAIGYARRGRGERKRPSSGWASLTPTELDVVRLVTEGLGNKEIAARLFVSYRTVQTHLTHVYTKLGLTSRVQLAQEAVRHNGLHSSSLEQR
jgi:predicted ATPase/class 3 adenylate cyclase/DNA-binding CsgD family transcriptional regulator